MAERGRVAIVATIALALTLAGCATTVVRPTAVATTPPPSAATTTPTPSPTPSLPIPGGFQPVALSAISESNFWVLGRSPCVTVNGCPAEILHTVNAGSTFQRIPAPATVYLTGAGPGTGAPTVDEIRFANPSDGWVFGSGPAWSTHDGGEHWQELDSNWTFMQLEPGANGYVYATVEVCSSPNTASECVDSVMRSPVHMEAWTPLTVPGEPTGRPVIGVHGDTVWVMYFERSTRLAWTSHDDGERWQPASMPCEPDLGGTFDPVSTTVVWAFCATGMEGGAALSTNGGASYTMDEGPPNDFWNGSTVAALSARYAFVGAGNAAIQLTTNGGETYRTLPQFQAALWVGFTDSEVGYVITEDQTTYASQLWRTTDAGNVWRMVALT
jgi:photosystem II stability/assembly factor-like uncharacterized protein